MIKNIKTRLFFWSKLKTTNGNGHTENLSMFCLHLGIRGQYLCNLFLNCYLRATAVCNTYRVWSALHLSSFWMRWSKNCKKRHNVCVTIHTDIPTKFHSKLHAVIQSSLFETLLCNAETIKKKYRCLINVWKMSFHTEHETKNNFFFTVVRSISV